MARPFLDQLEKHYKFYLKNLIMGKEFEPIVLKGGKHKPETAVDLHRYVGEYQANEKKEGKPGWSIVWDDWTSKKLGKQKWPSEISISTAEDLLYLIDREKECKDFIALASDIMAWNPDMQALLYAQPELVFEHKDDWRIIQDVVDALLTSDCTGKYIRSLSVPAHTKFIQQKKSVLLHVLKTLAPQRYSTDHTDLSVALGLKKKPFLFSMRFLDPGLSELYMSGVNHFAIPSEDLQKVNWKIKKIILVENETNLYLLPNITGTLAIFSSGKALHLLKDIPLFSQVQSFYWGDIDEDGFLMLNDIRHYYPSIQSILMDEDTVSRHEKQIHTQPHNYRNVPMERLSDIERKAYYHLQALNGRIEQEQLQQNYVLSRLDLLV